MPSYQSKNWVFTLNNPPAILPQVFLDAVSFMVYQPETAPVTGTPHLQGYVVTKKAVTLAGLKRLLPAAHWERRKGSHDEAVAYCTKEDTRAGPSVTFGVPPPGAGARTDLDGLAQMVKDKMPLKRIAEENPSMYIKHAKGLQALKFVLTEPRKGVRPSVEIFTGPSRIGKSKHIMSKYPDCYRKDSASKWWDGYDGQEVVFFDEFYGGIPYNEMLQIIDWHGKRVETKGGHVELQATKFVFASNKNWREWYSGVDDRSAFQARIAEFGKVHECRNTLDVTTEVDSPLPEINMLFGAL